MQSFGVSSALQNQNTGNTVLVLDPGFTFVGIAVITLVTGTMFLGMARGTNYGKRNW